MKGMDILSSDRIACKTEGCKGSILPYTAEKTGGYCMPCVQFAQKSEQDEFVRNNRVDVNLYEGVTDPVEILKIMHSPRKYHYLENYIPYEKTSEEIYTSLAKEDIQRLKTHVCDLMNQNDMETAKEILLSIVCFTNASIEECLLVLMGKENYYPDLLFKNASVEIRDRLIQQVDVDSDNRNHILLALAWIGDHKVVNLFNEWRSHPPEWAGELNVAPEHYASEAGWELTVQGTRRDLFYKSCFPFIQDKSSEHEAVSILQDSEQVCEWCNSNLSILFDLDLTHPTLEFLKIEGHRLRIATCYGCTCYGYIYTDIDRQGNFKWSKWNKTPDYLPDTHSGGASIEILHKLRMSELTRDCYSAASWMLEAKSSQVGGHPTWIQDAEYPSCPSCTTTMKFVGQLDWSDIEEYGEGICYAFVCQDCNVAATHYQQS